MMTRTNLNSSAEASSETTKRDKLSNPRARTWLIVNAWRFAIVGGFFAAWQWLPSISAVRSRVTFLDPFFISSPSRVAQRIVDVSLGRGETPPIWPNLQFTLQNMLVGVTIAVVAGTIAGLVLSNNPLYERILHPIVLVLNSIPRIAVVPVMILVAGSSAGASIGSAITVVIFLVFFNALEGGRSAPLEMIHSARVMGASNRDVMLRVRFPYVIGWVAAALPNAIAFGLVATVTTEIFVGGTGIGQLLTTALNTADSTLTFTIVAFLGVVGTVLVLGVDYLHRRLVPWSH